MATVKPLEIPRGFAFKRTDPNDPQGSFNIPATPAQSAPQAQWDAWYASLAGCLDATLGFNVPPGFLSGQFGEVVIRTNYDDFGACGGYVPKLRWALNNGNSAGTWIVKIAPADVFPFTFGGNPASPESAQSDKAYRFSVGRVKEDDVPQHNLAAHVSIGLTIQLNSK